MERVRRWAAAVAAAAISVVCATAMAVEVGSPAPDVTAPGLRHGAAMMRLSSLRGQVVYVDFWASWCVPCRASMPFLDREFRRLAGRGFTVLGVNKDVVAADAERFLKRVPVDFPLVSDPDDRLARAFEVKAMPSGYLIDRAGRVRYVHRGFAPETAAALRAQVELLLKEAR